MTVAIKYERIRFRPEGGKLQTVILRVTGETPVLLRGVEVDSLGDEVTRRNVDERVHIIQKSLITSRKPMKFNLHYGILEVMS